MVWTFERDADPDPFSFELLDPDPCIQKTDLDPILMLKLPSHFGRKKNYQKTSSKLIFSHFFIFPSAEEHKGTYEDLNCFC
jgi:hypothetical protein